MAAIADGNLTLVDWTKLHNPDGKPAKVAKMLSKTDQILDDVVHVEANGTTHHVTTVETKLPEVYWRQFNQGIPDSKGTHAQVEEGIGMMETRSRVDKRLVRIGGNKEALMMRAAQQKVSAMRNEMASTLFYGNSAATAAKFMGFAPRYSSLSAGNAANIIDAGGTSTDNTSIWLVAWGDDSVFCTFPKGSVAGLEMEDLGEVAVDVYNAAGTATTGRMQAYEQVWNWDAGLVVADWRQVARICNIDVSDLVGLTGKQTPIGATSYTTILKKMLTAYYRIENKDGVRLAFYMNKTAHEGLSSIAMEKSTSVLRIEEGFSQFGTPRTFTTFMGIPIRECDSIINAEERITA